MKKYDSYKNSGIEWLEEIPKHWDVRRIKDLGSLQNGVSKGKEYFGKGHPFVSYGNVYNDNIEILSISSLANSTEEEQKLYSVLEGDIFFTRTSETINEIGISATCLQTIAKGTFSGFVIRLRPNKNKISKEYSKFFFQAHINRVFLSKQISLVTRASLSQGTLNNSPVILPPIKEQIAIAKYLDSKTQAIDKKISILEQKITHYKDLRKSIINQAVTKGLDIKVKLKDSEIDWIGKIPEHWEVKRLKHFGSIETSSVNKKIEEDEDLVKLVNYMDVYNNLTKEIRNNKNYMVVSANNLQVRSKTLKKGDVLFTPSSETIEDIGVSAVVMEDLNNTLYSYHILRLRFTQQMNDSFKKYMFNNDFVQSYFSKTAKGTTRKILGLNDFNSLPVIVPPLNEQMKIAEFLDTKTNVITSIISNIESQITTLKELRKTLINDVVTGKINILNN